MTLQLPYNALPSHIVYGLQAAWEAGDVNVALLDNTYVFDPDHFWFSDVNAAEVVGTGYTAGGLALVAPYINYEDPWVVFRCDDPEWPLSDITARFAVFYWDQGGDPGASQLLACIDAEADVVSSGSSFFVPIATDGLFRVGLEAP